MRTYINHMLMNLGASLSCLYYAIVPPQFTGHDNEALESLAKYDLVEAFLAGLIGED